MLVGGIGREGLNKRICAEDGLGGGIREFVQEEGFNTERGIWGEDL